MPDDVSNGPACPICGDFRHADFRHKDSRRLLICRQCRHIFWESMPSGEVLRDYYSHAYTPSHNQLELQSSNRSYYNNHLGELVRASGSAAPQLVLADYGCSFPVLLEEAGKMGFAGLIGIEEDTGATDYGRRSGITMVGMTEFAETVAPGSIDIIRFSHVLEHLLDPVGTLGKAAEKLRPGGLLYITQPSFPVFVADEPYPLELADCVWPEHLHYFSPCSLWTMVKRAGFKVRRLFTHQNCEQVFGRVAPHLDLAYSAETLLPLASLGDAHFGRWANYPVFTGENSVLYAGLDA